MNNIRKHIAVLLVGIFFYPIVFQPFHVIWHHSPDAQFEHLCCQVEAVAENSLTGTSFESEDDQDCPVCEYQFAVKEVPDAFHLRALNLLLQRSIKESVINLAFRQAYSTKTPRAPPASTS